MNVAFALEGSTSTCLWSGLLFSSVSIEGGGGGLVVGWAGDKSELAAEQLDRRARRVDLMRALVCALVPERSSRPCVRLSVRASP